jgi:hypothetical protein
MSRIETDEQKVARELKEFRDAGRAYNDYLLQELRCARTRAKLIVNEIERIGVALKGGVIDADTAMIWLRDVNALEFLHLERGNGDDPLQGQSSADFEQAGHRCCPSVFLSMATG